MFRLTLVACFFLGALHVADGRVPAAPPLCDHDLADEPRATSRAAFARATILLLPKSRKRGSVCSGILIDGEKAITARHCVGNNVGLSVTVRGACTRATREAHVIEVHPSLDVAILRVGGEPSSDSVALDHFREPSLGSLIDVLGVGRRKGTGPGPLSTVPGRIAKVGQSKLLVSPGGAEGISRCLCGPDLRSRR